MKENTKKIAILFVLIMALVFNVNYVKAEVLNFDEDVVIDTDKYDVKDNELIAKENTNSEEVKKEEQVTKSENVTKSEDETKVTKNEQVTLTEAPRAPTVKAAASTNETKEATTNAGTKENENTDAEKEKIILRDSNNSIPFTLVGVNPDDEELFRYSYTLTNEIIEANGEDISVTGNNINISLFAMKYIDFGNVSEKKDLTLVEKNGKTYEPIAYSFNLNSEDSENIIYLKYTEYVSTEIQDNFIDPNPQYYYYYNSGVWYNSYGSTGNSSILPKTTAKDYMVEGRDYVRSWAFTKEIPGDTSDPKYKYLPEAEALKQTMEVGYIIERIEGIGDYEDTSSVDIVHNVVGYAFVMAHNAQKNSGEEDPEFTWNLQKYNNFSDDIEEYFDIKFVREEGEEPGTYKITPKINIKESYADKMYPQWDPVLNQETLGITFNASKGSIMYHFKNMGIIVVEPYKANLTIIQSMGEVRIHHVNEKGKYIEVDKNGENVVYREPISGKIGDEYTAKPISIPGYEYIGTASTDFDGGADNELQLGVFERQGVFTKEGFDIFFVYKPLELTLNFVTNGGSEVQAETHEYNDAISINNYSTNREYYYFDGWYKDEALTEKAEDFKITDNTTLYAKWINPADYPDTPQGDWDVSKSKEATELDENYETEVTISLPSSTEELETTVVFVVDNSSSTVTSAISQAQSVVDTLMEQVRNSGAKVNIGIVAFKGDAKILEELTILTEDNIETIKQKIAEGYKVGSGSNVHAGLIEAQKLLDSSNVKPNRKYMILITDGITRNFVGEDGKTKNIYYDYQNKYWGDMAIWNIVRNNSDKSDYRIPGGNWEEYYAKVKTWVKQDQDNYVEEFIDYTGNNGKPSSIVNKNNAPEGFKYIPSGETEHAFNVDRALYEAYNKYKDIEAKGYNTYAIQTEGYLLGKTFINALNNGKTLTFEDIKKDLLYFVDKGTIVKDYIGEDFKFVNKEGTTPFTVKINGEELVATKVDDNTYTFKKADDEEGTYRHKVTYHDVENGYIEWYINDTIDNFTRAQLSFKEKLVNYNTEEVGTIPTNTNLVATITPVDSNGDEGKTETFENPVVKYTISNVIANYVDENGVTLAASKEYKGLVNKDTYETKEESISGYHLIRIDNEDKKTGKFAENTITVTYVYTKDTGKVIIHYIDKNNNPVYDKNGNIIENEIMEGVVGDPYNTADKWNNTNPTIVANNYRYLISTGKVTGNYTSERPINVTYIYEKLGNVIINYVDETGKTLADSKTAVGTVGETYITAPVTIDHYDLKETPDNYTGTYTEDDITVNYVYAKKDGKVIVHYIDLDNNEIASQETLPGKVGETYNTNSLIKIINGYIYLNEKTGSKVNGTFTEEDIHVYYVYMKGSYEGTDGLKGDIFIRKQGGTWDTENKEVFSNLYEKDKVDIGTSLEIAPIKQQLNDVVEAMYKLRTGKTEITNQDKVLIDAFKESINLTNVNSGFTTELFIPKGIKVPTYSDTAYKLLSLNNGNYESAYDGMFKLIPVAVSEGENGTTVTIKMVLKDQKEMTDYSTLYEKFVTLANNLTNEPDYLTFIIYDAEIEEGVKNQTLTMTGNVNGSMKADALYYDLVNFRPVSQNRHFEFNWKSTQNHNEPKWQDAKDAIITDSNNHNIQLTLEVLAKSRVTTHFVDVDDPTIKLADDVVDNYDRTGGNYTTSPKDLSELDYILVSDSGNTTGIVTEEPIEVTYYYKKNNSTVTVYYKDINTGKELPYSKEELTGKIGTEYTTIQKEFTNTHYEFVKVDENGGTPKGTYTKEPIVVTYYYRWKQGNVIIHHVDKNTKEELVLDEETNLPKVITGNVDDSYTTTSEKITNYTLDSDSGNRIGTYTEKDIEVWFYYVRNEGKIIVHHVDKDTGKELNLEEVTGKVNLDKYTPQVGTFNLYEFIESDPREITELTFTENDQEVTFYYQKPKGKVEVHYIEKDGEEFTNEYEEYSGYIDETYKTIEKDIEGYQLVEVEGKKEGNYPSKATEVVNYYYKKIGKVTTHYYLKDTTTKLSEDEISTGLVGELFNTEAKDIKGYILVTEPSTTAGIYTKEEQVVTYYYVKEGTVTVHYVDENGKDLKTPVSTTDEVGKEYTTDPIVISNYELVGVPTNANGTYAETETHVIYVYKKITEPVPGNGTVIVHHVDGTGAQIVDDVRLTGVEGQTYETSQITKEGYKNVGHVGRTAGNFINGEIEVTYIYEKEQEPNEGTLIIHYIDNKGTTLKTDSISTKVEGTEYNTEAPTIDGYTLIATIGTTSGKYTNGTIEVTYIYEKNPEVKTGKVIVHHIATNGTQLSDDVVTTGEAAKDTYTTQVATIDGYRNILVIGNTSGTYTDGTIEVTYVYEAIPEEVIPEKVYGNVYVRYITVNGKELKEDLPITKEVGESYTTTAERFEGYELVSSTGLTSGTIKAGDSYVVYIYKEIEETPVVIPATGKVIVHHVDGTGHQITDDVILTGEEGTDYITTVATVEGYKNLGHVGQTAGEYINGTIEVTYIYEKEITPEVKTGTVIVRYIDTKGNSLINDVTITKEVGESYTTTKEIIDNYNLVSTNGNTSGTIVEGTNYVIYIYEAIPEEVIPDPVIGKVITHHLDTKGNKIADDAETTGEVGKDTYTTTAINNDKYTRINVIGNTTGTYTEGTTEVIYIYEEVVTPEVKTGTVITHYISNKGTKISEDSSKAYNVGETYTTVEKAIEGYKYVTSIGNTEGTVTEGITEITYLYEEIPEEVIPETVYGTVNVHHIDTTGKKIADDETMTGEVGKDTYETSAIESDKYTRVNVIGTTTGTYTEGTTEVIYIYKEVEEEVIPDPVNGNVFVRHITVDGTQLVNDEVITQEVGTAYTTAPLTDGNYKLVSTNGLTSGTIKQGDSYVIYIYKENKEEPVIPTEPETGKVVVRYLDTEGYTIAPTIRITDNVGEEYTTDKLPISGYKFLRVKGDTTVEIVKGTTYVEYIYEKETESEPQQPTDPQIGTVIAYYVDENGNAIETPLVITNTYGSTYVTYQKVIPGYTGNSIPENPVGKITQDLLELTYTYTKDEIEEEPSCDNNCNSCCNCNKGEQQPTIIINNNINNENNNDNSSDNHSENNSEINNENNSDNHSENNNETNVDNHNDINNENNTDVNNENNNQDETNVNIENNPVNNNESSANAETGDTNVTTGDTNVTTGDVTTGDTNVTTGDVTTGDVTTGDTNVTTGDTNTNIENNPVVENNTNVETGDTNVDNTTNVETGDINNNVETGDTNVTTGDTNIDNNPTNTVENNTDVDASSNNENNNTSESNPNIDLDNSSSSESNPTIENNPTIDVNVNVDPTIESNPTNTNDNESTSTNENNPVNNNEDSNTNINENNNTDSCNDCPKSEDEPTKPSEDEPTAPKTGKVIVKYLDEDGYSLSPSISIKGEVEEDYSTDKLRINGYELVKVEGTENGQIVEGTSYVTYIYKPETVEPAPAQGKVIVHYVDEEGNTLASDEITVGNIGDKYTTIEKYIENYELIDVQKKEPVLKARLMLKRAVINEENKSGNIVEGTTEITYIYTKTNEEPTPEEYGKLIVRYETEEGKLLEDESITTNVVGKEYTTIEKAFEDYEFIRIEGNKIGNYAKEDTLVKYIYKAIEKEETCPTCETCTTTCCNPTCEDKTCEEKECPKQGVVIAHYVDEDGKPISTEVIKIDDVDKLYSTQEKTIDGYNLKEVDGETVGKYIDGVIDVVYIYEKVEKDPEKEPEKEPEKDPEKEPEKEPEKDPEKEPESEKKYGTVITYYYDTEGNQLLPKKEKTYEVGANYTTIKETIANYTYKTVIGKDNGQAIEGTIEVIYIYEKVDPAKGSVVAYYVDTKGNKLSGNVTLKGTIGNKYTTFAKLIDNYKLVNVIGNTVGTYLKTLQQVTYVYDLEDSGEVAGTTKENNYGTGRVLPPNTKVDFDYRNLTPIYLVVLLLVSIYFKRES